MVNVVQQGFSTGFYNVWEDVDLHQTTAGNDGLDGHYRVHSLTKQSRQDFKQDCYWRYDDLYIIRDIYGGFLEFLKE